MENKSKFGLFGLVLASALLVGCGTTDVVEDDAGSAAAGVEEQQGAEVTALGGEAALEEETLVAEQQVEDVKEMLTVYYFDFDQAALSADTREALDIVAAFYKMNNKSIRLEGHADERGTREYNLALGERRANAVLNYLSVQGIDPKRIEVISYGEEKPAMVGSDEASWAKNRRVELIK